MGERDGYTAAGEAGTYTILRVNGKDVCALYEKSIDEGRLPGSRTCRWRTRMRPPRRPESWVPP
jgi:hypothetical protein